MEGRVIPLVIAGSYYQLDQSGGGASQIEGRVITLDIAKSYYQLEWRWSQLDGGQSYTFSYIRELLLARVKLELVRWRVELYLQLYQGFTTSQSRGGFYKMEGRVIPLVIAGSYYQQEWRWNQLDGGNWYSSQARVEEKPVT